MSSDEDHARRPGRRPLAFRAPDGAEKVTGRVAVRGRHPAAGLLHAKLLRSPHAHARSSGSTPARPARCPGVRAVLTAADIPRAEEEGADARPRRAGDRPRRSSSGQPVAAVAADELAIAEEALDLIEVEYEVLPASVDPLQSMQPGAPPVADAGTEADTSEALAHSAVAIAASETRRRRRSTSRSRRGCSAATWPRGSPSPTSSSRTRTACRWCTRATSSRTRSSPSGTRTGLLTLWASTQGSFNTRCEVADVLGIPENRIKVIPVECGGGFGGKIRALCEPITALLARATAGRCATS